MGLFWIGCEYPVGGRVISRGGKDAFEGGVTDGNKTPSCIKLIGGRGIQEAGL